MTNVVLIFIAVLLAIEVLIEIGFGRWWEKNLKVIKVLAIIWGVAICIGGIGIGIIWFINFQFEVYQHINSAAEETQYLNIAVPSEREPISGTLTITNYTLVK